jgi:hypothetical protein
MLANILLMIKKKNQLLFMILKSNVISQDICTSIENYEYLYFIFEKRSSRSDVRFKLIFIIFFNIY